MLAPLERIVSDDAAVAASEMLQSTCCPRPLERIVSDDAPGAASEMLHSTWCPAEHRLECAESVGAPGPRQESHLGVLTPPGVAEQASPDAEGDRGGYAGPPSRLDSCQEVHVLHKTHCAVQPRRNGALPLALALLLLASLAACAPADPTPTPAPSPPSAPTATIAPTAMPSPTWTATRAPTRTPEPTRTPVPQPPVKLRVSAHQSVYRDDAYYDMAGNKVIAVDRAEECLLILNPDYLPVIYSTRNDVEVWNFMGEDGSRVLVNEQEIRTFFASLMKGEEMRYYYAGRYQYFKLKKLPTPTPEPRPTMPPAPPVTPGYVDLVNGVPPILKQTTSYWRTRPRETRSSLDNYLNQNSSERFYLVFGRISSVTSSEVVVALDAVNELGYPGGEVWSIPYSGANLANADINGNFYFPANSQMLPGLYIRVYIGLTGKVTGLLYNP